MKPQKIEISHKTIIFTVIFLISLALLWSSRSIIVLFFICFLFMEALQPTVAKMEKIKIPRPLAIIILYLLILAFFSFAVAGVVPVFIEQTTALINTLPKTLSELSFFGTSAIDLSSQFQILERLPAEIAKTILSIFSNVFSAFIIFVITFYLLLERKNFDKYSFSIFGLQGKRKVLTILENLEKRLGSWVNAQMLLMVIVGILSYIAFLILGLPFAVPLAIVAGLLEIVPNIGPTVTAVIAGLVGLTISPLTGGLAVIAGILIQQIENNIIVPRIMKHTVGLNPLVTILVLATGAKLGGVAGAILSIPLFITIESIVRVVISQKNKNSKETVKPNSV